MGRRAARPGRDFRNLLLAEAAPGWDNARVG
jgi:hypothetical protein